MPVLSVITAAQAHRAALLREAGESLCGQSLPAGWTIEWLVQEDGDTEDLAEVVASFPGAHHEANCGALGVAITRNYALSRARGELVQVLDSDDILLPGAVAGMIDVFERHEDVHWAVGQADNLYPDGSRLAFPLEIAAGRVARGTVATFRAEHGRMPVHCASLIARTATVRALGGWVALPRGEDTALVLAMSELTEGYVTDEVTWLYRRHAGNMTLGPYTPAEERFGGPVGLQRVEAIRSLGLRL